MAGTLKKIAQKIGADKYTFAYSIQGVYLGAIIHSMEGKVNLWWRLFVSNSANGGIKRMMLSARLWLLVSFPILLHGMREWVSDGIREF